MHSHLSYAPMLGTWGILPEWFAFHQPLITRVAHGDVSESISGVMARKTSIDNVLQIDGTGISGICAREISLDDLLQIDGAGIAHIEIIGPMLKRAGFFAQFFGFTGTSTITAAVNQAAGLDRVEGILLHADSPGGHIGGIQELNRAVKHAASRKPVIAHVDELAASAAFWAIAPATEIFADPTAEIGSIGTMLVVADMSEGLAAEGIKIHVVSTGEFKGTGIPGAPVSERQLAELQKRVDGVNQFFLAAVREGRQLPTERLTAVSDGRVFLAKEARGLGLIDTIGSAADASQRLNQLVRRRNSQASQARMTTIAAELVAH